MNPLVPIIGKISKIVDETPDTKTFHVTTSNGKPCSPYLLREMTI
jgi:hypothetical protein